MAITRYIPTLLKQYYDITITKEHYLRIKKFKVMFENKGDHPLTLNSNLMGVYRFIFTPKDMTDFLDIFGIDEREFASQLKTIMHPTIPDSPLKKSFNVATDTFSMVVTWLLHICLKKNTLSSKELEDFRIDLANIWIYKHFTAKITHAFPKGANKAIMEATINGEQGISAKFAIIKKGIWYNVFRDMAIDVIRLDGTHGKTWIEFNDDVKIIYILNNVNTRCKDVVKNINFAFHTTKDANIRVASTSSIMEIDGEKLLRKQSNGFDIMILGLQKEIVNQYKWIDEASINQTLSMFKLIRKDTFKQILVTICREAAIQRQKNTDNQESIIKGKKVLTGMSILVTTIIHICYRHCIKNKVNMNSPLEILQTSKNILSSSRVLDSDIELLKDSVSYLLDKHVKLRHEATLAALRIAFMCYVIIRSFRYLKK